MVLFLLNNGTISQPPIPPSVVFAVNSNDIADDGTYLGGNYTVVGGVERNQPPRFEDYSIVGNVTQGTTLQVSATLINNSRLTAGAHVIKVYRGSTLMTESPTLVTTIFSYTVVGEKIRFDYPVVIGDIGKYLRFVLTPKLTSGDNTTGQDLLTDYTVQVTAPASALDVFDRIWTNGNMVDADWNSNPAAKTGKYVGSASPGGQNGPAPGLGDGTVYNKLAFASTSSHRFQQPIGSPAVALGFEIWLLMNIRSTTGTQTLWAGSGSIDIRINGGNIEMRMNGTYRTLGLATIGLKLYRFSMNADSSFLQINKGTKVQVPASPGSSLPGNNVNCSIGASFGLTSNFANIDIEAYGIRGSAMSDAQANAVFTLLNFIA